MPFADGRYPTPSGKIELYSEQMLRQGLDPLPDYTPEAESRDGAPDLAARYPIQLVSPAAHHFLNSSFADMPTMRKKQRRPTLELHPLDAAARGIADGDWVRAFNDRGEAWFVAEVKDSVGAGRGLPPQPLVGPLQPGGIERQHAHLGPPRRPGRGRHLPLHPDRGRARRRAPADAGCAVGGGLRVLSNSKLKTQNSKLKTT